MKAFDFLIESVHARLILLENLLIAFTSDFIVAHWHDGSEFFRFYWYCVCRQIGYVTMQHPFYWQ